MPVRQLRGVIRNGDESLIVGGDQRGHSPRGDDVPQQSHDGRPGVGIQLAGRLVGDQQLGVVRQRTGDRDALLLAPGHFRRSLIDVLEHGHILGRR